MSEESEAVKRALGYPYAIPTHSYALVDGGDDRLEAVPLDSVEVEFDLAGRTPLLAYGSNAAPEVLSRKLAATADPVPVVRTTLRDFDVVYSAHLSRYGSVPATLRRSPGAETRAFIAYLTGEQLRLVSATEPNYELASFDRPSCTLERGDAPAKLNVYVSRHGCLLLDGGEVALAEVDVDGRRFTAMSQRQLLELVRDLLSPGFDLPAFLAAASATPIPAGGRLSRGEAP